MSTQQNQTGFNAFREFLFGPCCLLPDQGVLLENGRRVKLGSRAFDILVLLVENTGVERVALVYPFQTWRSNRDPPAKRIITNG